MPETSFNPANLSNKINAPKSYYPRAPFKRGIYCSHCQLEGHTKEECFKIIGYPPGHPRASFKRGIYCRYCHLEGHTKEECFKLIGYPPGHPKASFKRGIYCRYCHLEGHTKRECFKIIGYPPGHRGNQTYGRGNQTYGRGSQSLEDEVDRISSLPEPILHKILSGLYNTEEVVRTSVLSKQWRYLWISLPFLDIDVRPGLKRLETFNKCNFLLELKHKSKFKEFANWVLLNGSVDLMRFRLFCLDFYDMATVDRWIHTAIMRKVKVLDLSFHPHRDEEIVELPYCLVTCESLEVLRLKLFGSSLSLPRYTGFTKLTVLEFNNVELFDDDLVGNLFESCPLLEDLSLIDCLISSLHVLRISCSKLKSLKLENLNLVKVGWREFYERADVLQVSCPKLTYFKYLGHIADKFIFENLDSLEKAVISPENMLKIDLACVSFGDTIRQLFGGLRHAASLSLNHYFLECVDSAWNLKELFSIPLENLKTLDVTTTMDEFGITMLIDLLERSPNLESLNLIIEEEHRRPVSWMFKNETVELDRLLMSHLKRVEFIKFKGGKKVLALIRSLLEFGDALEEMIFTWHYEAAYLEKSTEIMQEVSKFRKASTSAKLVARHKPI